MSTFEIEQDSQDQYRWTLANQNGDVRAVSADSWPTAKECRAAIEPMQSYFYRGRTTFAYKTYTDKDGLFRWRFVRLADDTVFARCTKGYQTEEACQDALTRAALEAVGAQVILRDDPVWVAGGPSTPR